MQPRVSIIVIFGKSDDARELLESLRKLAYENLEMLLVDNRLSESSKVIFEDFLRSHPPFPIRYIQNDENLGFAGGNNVGIRKVLGEETDYVLLLNDDTLVDPQFLAKLVEAAESDPKIGIVGPKIYFTNQELRIKNQGDGRRIWFGGGEINWLRNKGYHLNYDKPGSMIHDSRFMIQDVDYITGCCLLIKAAVIKKIGLMPEEYFLYYEDADWCLAAKKVGYRVVYVPAANIWHKVSRSAKAGSSSYIYYHVRNGLMMARKYADPIRWIALQVFIACLLVKQLIKLCVPSKREWAKACLLGIVDFYRGKVGRISV